MAPSIDVVVPAYNHWDLTSSCLRHLAAQTVAHRVILVDNGSTDGTREALGRDWPDVTVVGLDQNHPFTRAINLGVEAGAGDQVILLNNDVDLRPDCLEHLVAPLEQDPTVGSVAALLLQPGGRSIDSMGVTTDVTLAGFPRLQGLDPARGQDERPRLTGPEGTAAAYRRAAWEQVGGLDESIRAYMEILDLAWRLREVGWNSACAPAAVGTHLGSATFGQRSPEQRRQAGFSRGYLLRRYGVLRSRFAPRTLLTEALVVAADAMLARDLAALRGRLSGWRAARGMARRPRPPAVAIDPAISMRDSLGAAPGRQAGPFLGRTAGDHHGHELLSVSPAVARQAPASGRGGQLVVPGLVVRDQQVLLLAAAERAAGRPLLDVVGEPVAARDDRAQALILDPVGDAPPAALEQIRRVLVDGLRETNLHQRGAVEHERVRAYVGVGKARIVSPGTW